MHQVVEGGQVRAARGVELHAGQAVLAGDAAVRGPRAEARVEVPELQHVAAHDPGGHLRRGVVHCGDVREEVCSDVKNTQELCQVISLWRQLSTVQLSPQ